MRNEEPLWLKQWDGIKSNNCHICWHYSHNGICSVHKESPPKEFTDLKDNECADWKSEIPF